MRPTDNELRPEQLRTLNVEEERAVLDRVEPSDEEKTEALETIERHVAADPEHPFGFDDDDVPGSDEG